VTCQEGLGEWNEWRRYWPNRPSLRRLSLPWEAERLNFKTDRFCGWPQILRYYPSEGPRMIARDTLVMAIEDWLVMRS